MSQKDEKITQHQLYISGIRLVRRLKRQNEIPAHHKAQFKKIQRYTYLSAPFRWLQVVLYSRRIKKVDLKTKPPIFILGHWRSGTTHFHYMMAKDTQFSYLGSFQGYMFRLALVSGKIMRPIMNWAMPSTRPQDNIKIAADSPVEEEHPLTNLTEKCGMMTQFFPQNRSYFDKYNLGENRTRKEKEIWKSTYHKMLQTISYYSGGEKQLILKNPHNTSRIDVLLELYPNSKFINIHRNPYDVYRSTVHLWRKAISMQILQDISESEIHEMVLYVYETTITKYINELCLIPKSHFIDVPYAEFSGNEMSIMNDVYQKLGISGFDTAKPEFENYLDSIGDYKKNDFEELPPETISEINDRWKFAFDFWGYELKSVGL